MRTAVIAVATDDVAPRELAASLASGLQAAGRASTLVWVRQHRGSPAAPPVGPGVAVLVLDASTADLSRRIAPRLRDFEVVYGLAHGHPLMHAIREKRYARGPMPCFVAVRDDGAAGRDDHAPGESSIPRQFGEAYVLANCDLIIQLDESCRPTGNDEATTAPSRTLRCRRSDLRSMFDEVDALAHAQAASRRERDDRPGNGPGPSLTICMSHSDDGTDAGRALEALARQSNPAFSVIAVDTSTSGAASARLAGLMDQHGRSGWIYRRDAQQPEAAAIAGAVAAVSSRYLVFIDTDDALAPRFVDRALEAIELSGDDLLEVWSAEAEPAGRLAGDDDLPQDPAASAADGLDPVTLLGAGRDTAPLLLVRREALVAVGGYPVGLLPGLERQALAARVAMAGHRCDVLPEILNVRRVDRDRPTHEASRGADSLRRAFDGRLNSINMQLFAMTFQTVAQQLRDAERDVQERQRDLARRYTRPVSRERLRLLMVTPEFPAPFPSGWRQRRWATIRYLGRRHDLTLASFCSSEQSRHRADVLRYCRSMHAAAMDGPELIAGAKIPASVRSSMRATMRDALRAIPSSLYDAALIDSTFLAGFAEDIDAPAILNVPHIESRLLQQQRAADGTSDFRDLDTEITLTQHYEDEVWPRFAVRTAATPQDCDEIQARAGAGLTILVENGTDPELWLPAARSDTGRIIFFGDLGEPSSIDGIRHFWLDIWPHLVRRRPDLAFVVAGGGATDDIRKLALQPGFVLIEQAVDIRQLASTASVSIAPLRLQPRTSLNILDAMALGLPVVSTRIGCAGLSLEDGEHLMIRDDDLDFAEAIHALLGNAPSWQRLRRNAKAVVADRYQWDKTLAPLEAALLGARR